MGWKTHTANVDIFKFREIGDSIEGTFVELKPGGFKMPLLVLEDVAGYEEPVTCATSTGILQLFDQIFGDDENIPVGVRIRLRFVALGKAKPGQQPFKRFEMDVDEATIPPDWKRVQSKKSNDDEIPF